MQNKTLQYFVIISLCFLTNESKGFNSTVCFDVFNYCIVLRRSVNEYRKNWQRRSILFLTRMPCSFFRNAQNGTEKESDGIENENARCIVLYTTTILYSGDAASAKLNALAERAAPVLCSVPVRRASDSQGNSKNQSTKVSQVTVDKTSMKPIERL